MSETENKRGGHHRNRRTRGGAQQQQHTPGHGRGRGGGRGGGGGGRGRGGGRGVQRNARTPSPNRQKGQSKTNNHNNNNNSRNNTPNGGGRNRNRNRSRKNFSEYISEAQASEGLRIGKYLQGRIRINRDNAYVSVPGISIDVYIEGKHNRNRAFDGDTVILEIVGDESTWRVASGAPLRPADEDDSSESDEIVANASDATGYTPAKKSRASDDNDIDQLVARVQAVHLGNQRKASTFTDEEAERVRAEILSRLEHAYNANDERLQPHGAVVRIAERLAGSLVVGRLRTRRNDLDVEPGERFFMLVPNDRNISTILVLADTVPKEFVETPKLFERKLCLVDIVDWKAESYQPLGRFVETIGDVFNLSHETRALLMQHQINTKPHGPDAMACLPDNCENWSIPPEELARRRDFRKKRVFTIDPATARDLDDALHVVELKNGNFEVGVHIADVTHFMPAGCALDIDASKRATTVYLGESNIPMLPRQLCDDLCSLHPGVDRLTFSVVWEMTPEAEIVREWFGRAVIRSCSKMAYGVAQAMIDGQLKSKWEEAFSAEELKEMDALGPYDNVSVEDVYTDVMNLRKLAAKMRGRRSAGGSVSLNNVKLAFKFNDKNVPYEAYPYVTKEANNVIEDFMLLANRRVAAKIARTFPKHALLRQHDAPVERSVANFAAFVQTAVGVTVDTSTSLSLASSLATLSETVHPQVFSALQDMATRSMQLAKYFSTGTLPVTRWHHYALNMDRYTHFTSPIRRYADVLVHRQLHCALLIDQPPLEGVEVEDNDDDANELDKDLVRRAEQAEGEAKQSDALAFSAMLNGEALQAQAEVCNNRKLAARKVQDGRGILLLCLLVREKPHFCDGVVMSLGDRFLNVFVYQYGISEKVYMQDMSNLNGWIWNEASDHADDVAGESSSLVLQWTEKYDANDMPFSAKLALRENANELDDEPVGADDTQAERLMAQRAKAGADRMEAEARLQDEHMAGVGRKNKRHAKNKAAGGQADGHDDDGGGSRGGHPSQLPSQEQKIKVLDRVRVQLGMRPDSMRAMLRLSILHPDHPHFNASTVAAGTIEHESEAD